MNDLLYMDRDILLIENEISSINNSYKLIALKYNQSIKDAEYKIFKENGTIDDLEYYYREADNTKNVESEGLLVKVAKLFENIFTKIIYTIHKILLGTQKKNPSELVQYDASIEERIKDGETIKSKLQGLVNIGSKFAFGKVLGTIAAFLLPIFTKVYLTRKLKKAASAQVNKLFNKAEKVSGSIRGIVSNIFKKNSKDVNENDKDGFFSKLQGWLGGLLGACTFTNKSNNPSDSNPPQNNTGNNQNNNQPVQNTK